MKYTKDYFIENFFFARTSKQREIVKFHKFLTTDAYSSEPKRPLTAYISFIKERFKKVRTENPVTSKIKSWNLILSNFL